MLFRSILSAKRFVLATPRAEVALKLRFPIGEINLVPEIYNPVLDALAKGPCTLTELFTAIPSLSQEKIQQAVLVLLASTHVRLAPTGFSVQRQAATDRFNAVVIERASQSDELQYLASPVAATGIMVDLVDRLFLSAQKNRKPLVEFAWSALCARNQVLLKDGKPLTTPDENLKALAERAKIFTEKNAIQLQKLGIS